MSSKVRAGQGRVRRTRGSFVCVCVCVFVFHCRHETGPLVLFPLAFFQRYNLPITWCPQNATAAGAHSEGPLQLALRPTGTHGRRRAVNRKGGSFFSLHFPSFLFPFRQLFFWICVRNLFAFYCKGLIRLSLFALTSLPWPG